LARALSSKYPGLIWLGFFDPAIDATYTSLEQRFSCAPLQDRDRIAGIVVLGGTSVLKQQQSLQHNFRKRLSS
jgi:hypothetical protein